MGCRKRGRPVAAVFLVLASLALGSAIVGYHSTSAAAAAPTLAIAAGCSPAAIKCTLTPSKG